MMNKNRDNKLRRDFDRFDDGDTQVSLPLRSNNRSDRNVVSSPFTKDELPSSKVSVRDDILNRNNSSIQSKDCRHEFVKLSQYDRDEGDKPLSSLPQRANTAITGIDMGKFPARKTPLQQPEKRESKKRHLTSKQVEATAKATAYELSNSQNNVYNSTDGTYVAHLGYNQQKQRKFSNEKKNDVENSLNGYLLTSREQQSIKEKKDKENSSGASCVSNGSLSSLSFTRKQAANPPSFHRSRNQQAAPGAYNVRPSFPSQIASASPPVNSPHPNDYAIEASLVTDGIVTVVGTPLVDDDERKTSAHRNNMKLKHRNNSFIKTKKGKWSIFIAILLLAIMIVISVPMTNFETATESSPLVFYKDILPLATQYLVENTPFSPQALAYSWLMNDTSINQYDNIRKKQRFALAAFYYATGGENWDRSDGWLEYDTHECDWYSAGISEQTCDGSEFIHLDLHDNELNGFLPTELYLLLGEHLRTLDLSKNKVTGTIANEIQFFSNVNQFKIENNQINGTIPRSIGYLTQLGQLSLQNNKLSGTIPVEIGNLTTSLEELDIQHNSISGTLCSELGDLLSLEILNAQHNQIYGTMPRELGNLRNLISLDMEYNLLSGEIPKELGNLNNIEKLRLNNNGLTGTIPNELVLPNKLLKLELQKNDLNGVLPIGLCQKLIATDNNMTSIKSDDLYLRVDCMKIPCQSCGCMC